MKEVAQNHIELWKSEESGIDIFLNIHVKPMGNKAGGSKNNPDSAWGKNLKVKKHKYEWRSTSKRTVNTVPGKEGSSSMSSRGDTISNSWSNQIKGPQSLASGLKKIIEDSSKRSLGNQQQSEILPEKKAGHHWKHSSKKGVKCMQINLWKQSQQSNQN